MGTSSNRFLPGSGVFFNVCVCVGHGGLITCMCVQRKVKSVFEKLCTAIEMTIVII